MAPPVMPMRGIRCVNFVRSALFSIHKSAGKPKAGFGQIARMPEAQNNVRWLHAAPIPFRPPERRRGRRRILIVAAGTILTFNVLVGQVTVDANPFQMILGTIGAVFAGIAGGVVAGVVAPRFPFGHAAAVLLFLAVDTASVLAKGTGPAWFDLAGSGILAISVLFGGWIIAETARRRTGRLAAARTV
jgi:hypothetical protein